MSAPTVVAIWSATTAGATQTPSGVSAPTAAVGDLCVIWKGGTPAYVNSSVLPTYASGGADAGYTSAVTQTSNNGTSSKAQIVYKVLTSADVSSGALAQLSVAGSGTGRFGVMIFRHTNGWDASPLVAGLSFNTNASPPQTIATMTDVACGVVAVTCLAVVGSTPTTLQYTWAGSPNSTARDPYADESSSTTTTGGHSNHYGTATSTFQADYQEYDVADTPGTVTASAATGSNTHVEVTAEFKAATVSTAVGTATETDAGIGVGHSRSRAANTATETDVAIPVTRFNGRGANTATETDAAFAIRPSHVHAATVATETDTATAVRPSHVLTVGTASESDVAFSLAPQTTRSVTFSLSDPGDHGSATRKLTVYANKTSAFDSGTIAFDFYDGGTLLNSFAATPLTTTDTPYTLLITGTIVDYTTLSVVITVASAGSLTARINDVELVFDNELVTAPETDTAFSLRATRIYTVHTATETDTSPAIRWTRQQLVGTAVETEAAVHISAPAVVYGKRATIITDTRAAYASVSTANMRG